MAKDMRQETAKLIVTSAGLERARHTRRALKAVVPAGNVKRTGFKDIFALEAEGDVLSLRNSYAGNVRNGSGTLPRFWQRWRAGSIRSRRPRYVSAASRSALEKSFCFRLHKRGAHYLEQDTLTIEQEIGGDIWTALEEKHGAQPSVKLKNPDVAIVAEVLGPLTAVGVFRRAWREHLAAA